MPTTRYRVAVNANKDKANALMRQAAMFIEQAEGNVMEYEYLDDPPTTSRVITDEMKNKIRQALNYGPKLGATAAIVILRDLGRDIGLVQVEDDSWIDAGELAERRGQAIERLASTLMGHTGADPENIGQYIEDADEIISTYPHLMTAWERGLA